MKEDYNNLIKRLNVMAVIVAPGINFKEISLIFIFFIIDFNNIKII